MLASAQSIHLVHSDLSYKPYVEYGDDKLTAWSLQSHPALLIHSRPNSVMMMMMMMISAL